jgi:single-stranded-DNA-specific exonuclease
MKHTQGKRMWRLPARETVGVDGLLAQVAQQRGLPSTEVGVRPYTDINDGQLLLDVTKAVDHLSSLIGTDHEVVVYGDYDIDGLTATTLVVDVLTRLGIRVRPYIPDRFEEGYGLNTTALEALAAESVHTVITVDCGSTATGPIARAHELGLKMIITDHHLVGEKEPDGLVAHINPQRKGNAYPQPGIAGVGVAYHVMRALQQKHQDLIPEGQEKWWLDLVALGTVCDVVPLVGDNRIFTQYGLKVLARTRRPGLLALAEVSKISLDQIQASDLGFRFGPRLNASGRLEHARLSLDVLLATDIAEARRHATSLDTMNTKRQQLVAKILDQAREQALAQSEHAFLVVFDEDWSHGVAGLIAARLAEEFMKPAAVLQVEGDVAKGSVRTFGGIHVLEAMRTMDALLMKYGGHAAAAGLTLATSDIPALQKGLDEALQTIPDEHWENTRTADVWLSPDHVSQEGLAAVRQFEPTGRGHEPIIFVVEADVTSLRWVGADQTHAQVQLAFHNVVHRAMAFQALRLWPWLESGIKIRCYLQLVGNVWQGVERPDLHVVDMEEIKE